MYKNNEACKCVHQSNKLFSDSLSIKLILISAKFTKRKSTMVLMQKLIKKFNQFYQHVLHCSIVNYRWEARLIDRSTLFNSWSRVLALAAGGTRL